MFGGAAAAKPSGFAALASGKPADEAAPGLTTKLSFASAGSLNPFGSAMAGAFGGGFGSGFGAPIGGKLSSFAAPAAGVGGDKPVKAFGAPDSEAEDESDGDGSGNDEGSDEEASVTTGEKEKKSKLGKGRTFLFHQFDYPWYSIIGVVSMVGVRCSYNHF